MKRITSTISFLFCAFLGGAFAQTIGGAVIERALAGINLIGAINYSGTQGVNNSALWTSVTTSGTATDAYSSPINGLLVTGDTITQSGGGSVDGLYLQHDFSGAASGGRTGLNIRLRQTATTSEASAAWVGLSIQAWGMASDGGTGGTAAGKVFGINPQCILNASAIYFARCAGGEVNTTVATGANVEQKLGWSVIQAANDKVQGSKFDGGIVLAEQSGAVGWQCGWCTGNNDGQWPITSTGTIIGSWTNGQTAPGTGSAGTALYGLDWSQVTFASGGAPIVLPLITPANSSVTCKAGSAEWDASYIYVCTATNTWKRATLAGF